MLPTNQLASTGRLFKQRSTRLVRHRPIDIEDDANIGSLELDLRGMHRISNDEQGLPIRRDFVACMARRDTRSWHRVSTDLHRRIRHRSRAIEAYLDPLSDRGHGHLRGVSRAPLRTATRAGAHRLSERAHRCKSVLGSQVVSSRKRATRHWFHPALVRPDSVHTATSCRASAATPRRGRDAEGRRMTLAHSLEQTSCQNPR